MCPENRAPSAAFRIRVLDILQGPGYRTILASATSAIDYCFLTLRLPAISCNVGSWGPGLPFSGDIVSRAGRLAEVGGLSDADLSIARIPPASRARHPSTMTSATIEVKLEAILFYQLPSQQCTHRPSSASIHKNQLLGLANSLRACEIAEKGRLTQTKSHMKTNVSDPNTKLEQSERKAVLYLQRFT